MRRNAIYKIFQGKQTIDVFEEIVSLKKKKSKKKSFQVCNSFIVLITGAQ